MAQLTILKNASRETIAKVHGAAGSVTINFSDILAVGQVEDTNPLKVKSVPVIEYVWATEPGATITVSRNGEDTITLFENGTIFFGEGGNESHNSEHPLVVTIAGGKGYIWIRLRKHQGFLVTNEHAEFSQYDNPTLEGE